MLAGAPAAAAPLAHALLDQLLVTVSSGAGATLLAAAGLQQRPGGGPRAGLFYAAGVAGVGALGASLWCGGCPPLQNMVFVVVSTTVTGALSLPEEPSDYLAAPSVAFYLACAAAALHALRAHAARARSAASLAFLDGVAPYLVVYVALRAIARLARRPLLMLCLSASYVALAPAETPDAGLARELVLFADSFAGQGLVVAATSFATASSAAAGPQLAALYALALLAAHAARLGGARAPRVQFCLDNLCFAVAQELIGALQRLRPGPPSPTVPCCVFAAAVAALAHAPPWDLGYASACTVALGGLSVVLAGAAQALAASAASPAEGMVLYGALFCALQACADARGACTPSGAARDAAIADAAAAVVAAGEDIS